MRRQTNPDIALWWNTDTLSRHGISKSCFVTNGHYYQSYRLGGFCMDVGQPTEFSDVFELEEARGRRT